MNYKHDKLPPDTSPPLRCRVPSAEFVVRYQIVPHHAGPSAPRCPIKAWWAAAKAIRLAPTDNVIRNTSADRAPVTDRTARYGPPT